MEENKKNKNFQPLTRILLVLLMFAIVICATYFLCLFFVTFAIVIVALAIIYGVCHTVLEFVRLVKKKSLSGTNGTVFNDGGKESESPIN